MTTKGRNTSPQITVRLSPGAGRLLEELSARLNITRTAVMNLAVTRLAEVEGVRLPEEEEAGHGPKRAA